MDREKALSVFFWVNSLIQHTSLPDFPRFGSLICFFRKIAEKRAVFVIFELFFACADGHFPGEKTAKSPRKTLFVDEKTLLRCLRAILYSFISEFPGKKPRFFQKKGKSASFYIENSYKGMSGQAGSFLIMTTGTDRFSVRRSRKAVNLSASAADTSMKMLFSINARYLASAARFCVRI